MRKKYTDMADTRSSAWFKLSSNKEADERGSRASISVEGLRLSTDDPATTRLAGMCAIAHNYFHKLHTPEPASGPHPLSQDTLLREIQAEYSPLPGPASPQSGPFLPSESRQLSRKMPNSTPGPDGIHYPFWKALAHRVDQLTEHDPLLPSFWHTFTNLANDLRTHGTNRLGLKDANLSLFFKKGDPTLVANYQLISSMNTDCKMYTNLVNARLAPWAMTKLHDNQKGFVPLRYITEHTRLCAEITHLSNLTETPGYIVSLDQAKAYDRVDLPLLLDTLSAMGLPADLILMIRDITSKCRTRVRINSGYSRTFTLHRGVRQGDPLSCLLYAFSIEPMGMRL
jgi:hypothetical protein